MKVQFEFSPADLADVSQRLTSRSQTVRGARWLSRATWAFLISLAVFFALKGDLVMRVIYSILLCAALVAVHRWLWGSSPDSRLAAYYRERLGGDGPFICEVEMTAEGVTGRQCGIELKYPWSSIQEIVDTPGGLEFAARAGFLVVRDRAFHTPEQRSDFLRAARQFLTASAAGSGTPSGPGDTPPRASGHAEGPR
jgi:hypothetical protein